jgi:Flp pilus assembly protein TadG
MHPSIMSSPRSRRIWGDQRGIAFTEFALVLPFLLLLMMGGYELSRLIIVNQRLEKVAYTVTDVVAQQTSVTNAQLGNIMTAAAEIMQPYPFSANGDIILSSVYQNGTGTSPTVKWQYKGGGTLASVSKIGQLAGIAALPSGLTLNNTDNVIIAEVFYNYTPLLIAGPILSTSLYKVVVFKPRLGALTTPPN